MMWFLFHCITFKGVSLRSQLRLKRRASLPSITSLQLGPRGDGARLDAQVALPSILWLEVTHGLDLVFPSIPDRDIGQSISSDDKGLLVVLLDNKSIALFGRVYSICLTSAYKSIRLFRECLCASNLVNVLSRSQARDGGLVDVLVLSACGKWGLRKDSP
jgi:hypothetical protein